MTQAQAIHGGAGQVIQAETFIQNSHGRPLMPHERIDLNRAVKRIEDQGGDPTWKTWQFLHQAIEVKNIEDMRIDHLGAALALLALLLQVATLKGGERDDASGRLEVELDSLRQRLVDESSAKQSLLKRHEMVVAAAEKHEKAATTLTYRLQQVQSDLTTARKRVGWLRPLFWMSLVTALVGGFVAYSQWQHAQESDSRLTICAFEGKGYGIGSILNSTPPRECVRAGDGQMAWVAANAKAKRSR